MNKQTSRDVRRGTTRFNQSSGHKLFSCLDGVGADFVLSEKSKKERLRKLSALGRGASSSSQDYKMGCDVSDREDELPSKRFKLPKKFFDDCNGVDHASVPRKLRSAMKKRSRESLSPSLPNSKKLNHAMSVIESPKRDGAKKPRPCLKQGDSDRSQRETASGSITKDEEEVVETLYALAGLFPNTEANDNCKLDSESLYANPSALPESKEDPTPALESGKDKFGSFCPLGDTKASGPSGVGGLAKETDKVDSLNKPSTQHQPELPHSTKFCIDSDNSVPQLNPTISSLLAKVEQCNEKPIGSAVNFGVPSELSLDSGRLKQPVQQETSISGRKPDIALELGTTIGSQVELHDMVQESKKNGLVLWPGLSSNVSHEARNDTPSSRSPATKVPAWMAAALSASRISVQNDSFGKATSVAISRRSFKKCAAHVYISHLIQALQMSESKDKLQLQPNQLRPHEGSKQGALLGVNIYTKVKNSLNGFVSASSIGISTAEKNRNEAKNSALQQKKLHQDQLQSSMASAVYTTAKQKFDFLSMLAGGSGLETNDSFSRARNGMEPSSQPQVPYLHSLVQHHPIIPFSFPHSRYNSSAFPDNPSGAQQAQLQLPPYHGNPFCGPQASATALTKQQPQQQQLQLQQQQQQRLWAAQLATQYRPAGSSAAVHFPSWQIGRQEASSLLPCPQALISPSPSTLELVGPNYTSLSQQQQQLMAVTSSFPPGTGRVKQQDHHLPSVYEESSGGFRAGSAMPLQLLCNERL